MGVYWKKRLNCCIYFIANSLVYEFYIFISFCNETPIVVVYLLINSLSVNFTKWSNTLKQSVGKLPTNCLSIFDHFVGLAVKGLNTFLFSY